MSRLGFAMAAAALTAASLPYPENGGGGFNIYRSDHSPRGQKKRARRAALKKMNRKRRRIERS